MREEQLVSEPVREGIYQHYKGRFYHVLGVARHSETEQEHVVYRALYGERGLWLRPLEMFRDYVERGGRRVRRFAWVASKEEDIPRA